MKLIGLTGGIACGKSTAAELLRKLGVHVIDADAVAREVVAPGSEGLRRVVQRFGPDVLTDGGEIDRSALGAVVMSDAEAKRDLEAITHPLIQAAIATELQARAMSGEAAVAVEAALLVETGSWRHYDALWVVRASRAVQIERLMQRKGCDQATAELWIDNQLPVDEKARHASVVLDNDGTLDELEAQVEAAYEAIKGSPPS